MCTVVYICCVACVLMYVCVHVRACMLRRHAYGGTTWDRHTGKCEVEGSSEASTHKCVHGKHESSTHGNERAEICHHGEWRETQECVDLHMRGTSHPFVITIMCFSGAHPAHALSTRIYMRARAQNTMQSMREACACSMRLSASSLRSLHPPCLPRAHVSCDVHKYDPMLFSTLPSYLLYVPLLVLMVCCCRSCCCCDAAHIVGQLTLKEIAVLGSGAEHEGTTWSTSTYTPHSTHHTAYITHHAAYITHHAAYHSQHHGITAAHHASRTHQHEYEHTHVHSRHEHEHEPAHSTPFHSMLPSLHPIRLPLLPAPCTVLPLCLLPSHLFLLCILPHQLTLSLTQLMQTTTSGDMQTRTSTSTSTHTSNIPHTTRSVAHPTHRITSHHITSYHITSHRPVTLAPSLSPMCLCRTGRSHADVVSVCVCVNLDMSFLLCLLLELLVPPARCVTCHELCHCRCHLIHDVAFVPLLRVEIARHKRMLTSTSFVLHWL